MSPERRSRPAFGAFRAALCCLLTLYGVTWCAAESVSVSGQVVDSQGNPVTGVKVRLAVVADRPPYTVAHEVSQTSQKAGKYSLGPVEVGKSDDLVVAVYEPGKWIGWASWGAMEASSKELVVSKPSAVTGVVVDEAGKPMSGVTVGYDEFGLRNRSGQDGVSADSLKWLHPFKAMVTGADGKYRLSDVPSHMIVTPSASKEWYGPKSERLGSDEGNKRITMIPAGSLTGRVIGPDGRPSPGVMVHAHGVRSCCGGKYTNSDGVFRIDGLSPGVYSAVALVDDGPGSSRDDVRVKIGAMADAGDLAIPTSVELSGRVLDMATGKPIKGAKVSVYGEGVGSAESISDANGVYKLGVLPGKVTFSCEGAAPLYFSSSTESVEITVPAEGTRGYDVRLAKADQAHGKVIGATGKPVAGAIVSIGSDWNGARTVADSSGKFTIAVPREKPGGG